ncbi:MAG: hypothetical protein WAW17_19535 [Rhodococcus sp. (in: high G+C Gram-positive bacteria)]|uniref:hypothetical protein n=1 Tax=Rhodococcus sp. TaxID=1831 RepID=UPI003BAE9645
MMTWILWLGALLVVAGAGALLKGATVPARVLWLLAELSFVAVLIWGAHSVLAFLAVAAAVVVTLVLVAVSVPGKDRQGRTTDAE